MKKYLLSTAAAVLVTTTSFADTGAKNCSRNFGGFYVGVNAGYGLGSSTVNTRGTGAQASKAQQKNNLSLRGFNGGLHAGYGWLLNRVFYLGLEAYGKVSNLEGSNEFHPNYLGGGTVNNTRINVKNRNSFGVAARLGGVLNGMLTYVKVGVETSSWKFRTTFDEKFFTAAAVPQGDIIENKSKRLTGIPLGIGMETFLTDHVTLGGEFVYTHYTTTTNVKTAKSGQEINTKFRPKTTAFNVRLSYKW